MADERTRNAALAFVFPGQGSQSLGMLSDWSGERILRDTFAEAGDVLGYDLWRLTQEGPQEDLDRTDRTQPALLTAGVALWRLWLERGGPAPGVMAGHSLGEYTALVCAGSLAFGEAVQLVADRGRYMQEAVAEGEGSMAAILGLDDDVVRQVCADAADGQVAAPVNFNAPGQVVIAGHRAAVERAVEGARQAGAKKVVPLAVSAPSHCELMRPAAERLAARLGGVEVAVPSIPVVHNVDVGVCPDTGCVRDCLVEQLANPVRWSETVLSLAERGISHLVECGPGKVLSGLTRRIDRKLQAGHLGDPAGFDKAFQEVAGDGA